MAIQVYFKTRRPPTVDLEDKEIILTSHAPFIASDLPREHIRIFEKVNDTVSIHLPDVETFGATYDRILNACFGVEPPISSLAHQEIDRLRREGTAEEIAEVIEQLGSSVDRALLADRLVQLADGRDR